MTVHIFTRRDGCEIARLQLPDKPAVQERNRALMRYWMNVQHLLQTPEGGAIFNLHGAHHERALDVLLEYGVAEGDAAFIIWALTHET